MLKIVSRNSCVADVSNEESNRSCVTTPINILLHTGFFAIVFKRDHPDGDHRQQGDPTDDGWMIVAVFDSKQDWERFRDQDLGPGLQNAEGVLGPPQEKAFEVANLQQG